MGIVFFFSSHKKNLKLTIGNIEIFVQDLLVITKLTRSK